MSPEAAPGPEVGSVAVSHPAHGSGYRIATSVERGEQHVPGPLDRSEVAAADFLLVAAIGCELAGWHALTSIIGHDSVSAEGMESGSPHHGNEVENSSRHGHRT
jgi:hypothetical protein